MTSLCLPFRQRLSDYKVLVRCLVFLLAVFVVESRTQAHIRPVRGLRGNVRRSFKKTANVNGLTRPARALQSHSHVTHNFSPKSRFAAAGLSPRKLSLLASAGLLCQLASSGGSGAFGAFPSALNGFEDFGAKLSAILNSTADANSNDDLRMRFGAVIPGDSAAESVLTLGLYNFLNYYNFAIVARLLLTWFPNPPQVLVGPLSAICDPYLNLFRGIIPPLGQLDLSPIISLGLLNFITSATAALPCELPVEESRNPYAEGTEVSDET